MEASTNTPKRARTIRASHPANAFRQEPPGFARATFGFLGEDEVAAGEVTFKPLRGGEQMRISADDVGEHLAAMLLGGYGGDEDDTLQQTDFQ